MPNLKYSKKHWRGNKALLIKRIFQLEEKIEQMLKVLDQITALTKNGRGSRLARAVAEFIRQNP